MGKSRQKEGAVDPDVTLAEARRAAQAVTAAIDGRGDLAQAAETLAERFRALDEWLCRGGFKPRAWR
jgi:hypothetical protein